MEKKIDLKLKAHLIQGFFDTEELSEEQLEAIELLIDKVYNLDKSSTPVSEPKSAEEAAKNKYQHIRSHNDMLKSSDDAYNVQMDIKRESFIAGTNWQSQQTALLKEEWISVENAAAPRDKEIWVDDEDGDVCTIDPILAEDGDYDSVLYWQPFLRPKPPIASSALKGE
jgi:hypothetical protein